MSKAPTAYVKTKRELSERLKVGLQNGDNHLKKPGFPKKTKRGWHVEKCRAFIKGGHIKGKKPIRTYVKTFRELGERLDLSRQTITGWAQREGFPVKTKRGWNVEKCLAFITEHKRRYKDKTTGENADLKRRKLELEIETAEEKLKLIRRESISIEEHNEELGLGARFFIAGMAQFKQEVAANTKDPKMLKLAENVSDRVTGQLREQARAIGDDE